jgi:hypothetical protein
MHVDVHPGDRAARCRALMEPVELLYERGTFVLVHRCTACGHTRRNRASPDDDISSLMA